MAADLTMTSCDSCGHAALMRVWRRLRQAAKEYDTHLQAGANIAGFLKVADAMLAQGVV